MREISGCSVGPTASDSMLKPRRLNSPATRASTPGLFSTSTDSVWTAHAGAFQDEVEQGAAVDVGGVDQRHRGVAVAQQQALLGAGEQHRFGALGGELVDDVEVVARAPRR